AVVLDRLAGPEILELEKLADLDLAVALVRIGAALDPLDCLCERLDLEDPIAGDQLLGLGEWAIDHGALCPGVPDARALRARLEPRAFKHHAGLDQLLVVLRHRGEHLLRRHLARFRVLRRLHDHHETHWMSPLGFGSEPGCRAVPRPAIPGSTDTTSEG